VTRTLYLSLAHKSAHATSTLDLGGANLQSTFTCLTSDPACFNTADELLTDGRAQASLRNVVRSDRSMTLYGADFSRGSARIDDGVGDVIYRQYAQSALYAQQRWADVRNDTISLGLRGERDGGAGGAFSPSLGAVARFSSDVSLKANVGTAFRAPNVEDLYYPGFSNPHLVPERTGVGDVTIVDNALAGGTSLGWFFISGKNLIVLDNTFTPQNIGDASIAGLSFVSKTRPLHGIVASLDITNLYRAQDLGTNTRIPNRGPVFAGRLALDYAGPLDAFVANAGISMRSEGPRSAVNTTKPLFDQAAAYSRLNAYIGLRAGRYALVTLRGINLGNERYAEIPGYPMPGRSFAVELSTK
jgi:vitamin B12 transporter